MTRTVGATLRVATARLQGAGIPGAARDARLLMAEVLAIVPGRLLLAEQDAMPPEALAAFEPMITARAAARPVSQIIGRRSFWGRLFEVTCDVLDPRPETESLIALALDGGPARRVLDLGTGSGAILLTLLAEWPDAQGLGTDISAAALAVAERNADALEVSRRAEFLHTDWTNGVDGRFDLIVSNPPYIAASNIERLFPDVRLWEPHVALCPGATGLEAYRRIAAVLAGVLAPDGWAFFEIGPDQAAPVAAIFAAGGFPGARVFRDMDGRDRVIAVC